MIRLDHVTKRYPTASRPALDDATVGIEVLADEPTGNLDPDGSYA